MVAVAIVIHQPAIAQSAEADKAEVKSSETVPSLPANIPQATTDIYLDAEGGKYSSTSIRDLGNANALRTTLTIIASRYNPMWHPRIVIAALTADEKSGKHLEVVFDAPLGTRFAAEVYEYEGKKYIGSMKFGVQVELGQSVDISIDWDEGGTVIAKIGTAQPVRVRLGAPVKTLYMSTSGSEAKYSPFLLAHSN
ncbi:MAG: hypothetical protein JO256_01830 [Alphaproteobacteria bacterium]|nr:hypothetical protein [Alphaproteobacteria bacterium]